MELEATITQRRRQTRSGIYRYLYEATGFCSRQSIARDLYLSLPTVYQNLSELMAAGLVCSSGEHQATGGRRASGLSIVPDARCAIGVSVTEDRIRIVAADLRLQELAYQKVYHHANWNMQEFGVFLAKQLEDFVQNNRLNPDSILGVGIALPAVISPQGDRINLGPTLHLHDISLDGLTQDIPFPTFVDNDGTSGGYAEWFIQAKQCNMAYLSLENGVGGAVLLKGDQYIGDNRRSGEFGHMCVEPGGLPCQCGKRGCLEAYCSARRISDDLGITLKEFFTGVEQHNHKYEELWDDVLRHLAIGIGNIRMALDCDVVLGGFLTQYLRDYFPQLKAYVAQQNVFTDDTEFLHLSHLPRHTVPLGVALHFIKDFIENI